MERCGFRYWEPSDLEGSWSGVDKPTEGQHRWVGQHADRHHDSEAGDCGQQASTNPTGEAIHEKGVIAGYQRQLPEGRERFEGYSATHRRAGVPHPPAVVPRIC